MKNTILLLASILTVHTYAQTAVTDTAIVGQQYKDAVYYQLSSGNKTTALNNNWHLAFSVQKILVKPPQIDVLQAVSVRINEANVAMEVFQKAAGDTAFYSTDTTGFSSFQRLRDSDSDWDTSAFNYGLNIQGYKFGWGNYNEVTKNVVGGQVYYIKLQNVIKKIRINEVTYDTIWNFQYANLDNSNLQSVSIPKKSYQGKLFAYLNLETNTVLDREPLAANWDLLFHKYFALDVPGVEGYPSVGVWSNKGIEVAQANGVDVSTNAFSGYTFSKKMNEIGRDWKEFVAPVWELQDSLLYFVKNRSGQVFKIRFTEFSGSATGNIIFDKTLLTAATNIQDVEPVLMQCYPNPVGNYLTVITDGVTENTMFRLIDLSGRTVLSEQLAAGFTATKVDVQSLQNGVYVATIETNGNQLVQRVVVNR